MLIAVIPSKLLTTEYRVSGALNNAQAKYGSVLGQTVNKEMTMVQMTRRGFLLASGATLLGGSLSLRALAAATDLSGSFEYSGWENFHRTQWSWDKKTRGAHLVNCTGA